MIGSILEWTMDRFQDALLTEELDPGLFRKSGRVPEEKEARSSSSWTCYAERSDRTSADRGKRHEKRDDGGADSCEL